MAELIRIDVVEHRAAETTGRIKKTGSDGKTRTKTPDENDTDKDAKKEEKERAKALANERRVIRNTLVYSSMAVRKLAQVTGEIAHDAITNSYNRQGFDAQMAGNTRKAQLLQNQKTRATATTSFVTTNVNNAASMVAGFAINPTLGAVQLATYVAQLGINILNQMITYSENMRQYSLKAEREVAQSEYNRKRLLTNTFTNRGLF